MSHAPRGGTVPRTVQLGHGSGGRLMKRLIDEVFLAEFDAPELHAGDDAGVAPFACTGPRTVQLGHGSGGRLMKRLIDEVFLAEFDAPELHAGDDAGVAPFACTGRIAMSTDSFVVAPAFFRLIDEVFLAEFDAPELHAGDDAGVAPFACTGRIAMSTDSFVVAPAFFPGGNIGRLAVCGTVNDVATSGARVRYLSCGFILEEGFPLDDLRAIAHAMMQTAREAGVRIVTGDTKVVERGGADGIYINTAGVGELPAGVELSGSRMQTAREAGVRIVTGDTKVVERGGADGIYINTAGVGELPAGVELSGSRCRPGDLVLVSGTLGDHGIAVVSQREGLAFSAPVESDAAPLNRLVAVVPAREAEAALAAMRANRYGEYAAIIGEVREAGTGSTGSAPAGRPLVRVRCSWGATRILDTLVGPQLPRIC